MLLQVSDIHISIFQDSNRILQFEDFCNVAILQVIKPEVVLVTGIKNLTYKTHTYTNYRTSGESRSILCKIFWCSL